MKKLSFASLLLTIAVTFSSCEAIAGIFKAGMWSGIIIVVIVIVLVIWLLSRIGGKK